MESISKLMRGFLRIMGYKREEVIGRTSHGTGYLE